MGLGPGASGSISCAAVARLLVTVRMMVPHAAVAEMPECTSGQSGGVMRNSGTPPPSTMSHVYHTYAALGNENTTTEAFSPGVDKSQRGPEFLTAIHLRCSTTLWVDWLAPLKMTCTVGYCVAHGCIP
jgi:hypothetical protein